MSVIYMFSPDVGDLSGLSTNFSISTGGARTGSRSLQSQSGTSFLMSPFPTKSEIYWRQGIYQEDFEVPPRIYFRNGETTQCSIYINFSTGQITLYRGAISTWLAESTLGAIPSASWVCLEVHLVVDDTNGIFEVLVEGNNVVSYSGDTSSDSTTYVNNVYNYQGAAVTPWYRVDDLMCRDDDWCGQGGLYVLTPTANGSETDWTPSTGNPWECIDEIPPSFSDYIYETISGYGQHLFEMSDLPSELKIVTAVQALAFAKVPYASSLRIANIIKSNSTVTSGIDFGLSTSDMYISEIYDNDPDTDSGWTVGAVNALEAGIKMA